MKHKPSQVSVEDGYRALYEFPNGYRGSVVCHRKSYGHHEGTFEVAVMRGYECVYDTPITGDVLGGVEHEEIEGILDAIAALPKYQDAAAYV